MSRYDAPVEVATPDDARARVMTMVADLCGDSSCRIHEVLDQCVADAVDHSWSSAVRNFVPVIAFREVRGCVERGFCPGIPESYQQ